MRTGTQDITAEIRDLFDTKVGHFADKSARWLFRQAENVQGLIRILAKDLEEHLDFQRLTVLNRSFVDDTLRDLQSDMVFSVPFSDTTQGEDVTIDMEVRNIIMTGAEALIEQGIEQGIERGSREMLIHNIFTVLSERFSHAALEPVRAVLETVSDLTVLTELFRIAIHIANVEAFLNTIDVMDA